MSLIFQVNNPRSYEFGFLLAARNTRPADAPRFHLLSRSRAPNKQSMLYVVQVQPFASLVCRQLKSAVKLFAFFTFIVSSLIRFPPSRDETLLGSSCLSLSSSSHSEAARSKRGLERISIRIDIPCALGSSLYLSLTSQTPPDLSYKMHSPSETVKIVNGITSCGSSLNPLSLTRCGRISQRLRAILFVFSGLTQAVHEPSHTAPWQ